MSWLILPASGHKSSAASCLRLPPSPSPPKWSTAGRRGRRPCTAASAHGAGIVVRIHRCNQKSLERSHACSGCMRAEQPAEKLRRESGRLGRSAPASTSRSRCPSAGLPYASMGTSASLSHENCMDYKKRQMKTRPIRTCFHIAVMPPQRRIAAGTPPQMNWREAMPK